MKEGPDKEKKTMNGKIILIHHERHKHEHMLLICLKKILVRRSSS